MKNNTEKSRYRLFARITDLLTDMNATLAYTDLKIETNTEYTPDALEEVLSRYAFICHVDEEDFVHGRGYRKSQEHGMKKFMKFPMHKKETTNEGYHNDPFRAVNFKTGEDSRLVCSNGKAFNFAYRKKKETGKNRVFQLHFFTAPWWNKSMLLIGRHMKPICSTPKLLFATASLASRRLKPPA